MTAESWVPKLPDWYIQDDLVHQAPCQNEGPMPCEALKILMKSVILTSAKARVELV